VARATRAKAVRGFAPPCGRDLRLPGKRFGIDFEDSSQSSSYATVQFDSPEVDAAFWLNAGRRTTNPYECEVTNTYRGTIEDLHEVVAMYVAGQIVPEVERPMNCNCGMCTRCRPSDELRRWFGHDRAGRSAAAPPTPSSTPILRHGGLITGKTRGRAIARR
jgi:hypothetical protein